MARDQIPDSFNDPFFSLASEVNSQRAADLLRTLQARIVSPPGWTLVNFG
jgi:hypothetical protein